MKKYKPFDAVKFLLLMLCLVAAVVVFAPVANSAHAPPEQNIIQIANCLVLVRNTDLEPKYKASLKKGLSDMLDSYIPVYPDLVIKYVSRSEGFLVGAAFGRYGDDETRSKDDRVALLVIIANELFDQYCTTKEHNTILEKA